MTKLSMTPAQEYRDLAMECARSAEGAESEELRATYLDMARVWMQAALEIETSLVPGGSEAVVAN